MTEMAKQNEALCIDERLEQGPRFWSLPAVAFVVALLAAPAIIGGLGLLLTAAGFIGIVVAASVVFGGPSYLLVGAPLFWLTALRGYRGAWSYAAAGFLANLIAAPIMAILVFAFGGSGTEPLGFASFVHGFGLVFAPVYGLLFGWVFSAMVDPDALPPPKWALEEEELEHV